MRIAVVGIGTEVGKTVVSALLCARLGADYYKPISSGGSDRELVAEWSGQRCFPETVCLKTPVASHTAAQIEGVSLDLRGVQLPPSDRLVVEGAGGVLSPFCGHTSMLDLFLQWELDWVVVSRTYLGSINHTMLTISALRARGVEPKGVIFVGERDDYICQNGRLPCLGVIPWRPPVTKERIEQWKMQLDLWPEIRPTAGTPSHST